MIFASRLSAVAAIVAITAATPAVELDHVVGTFPGRGSPHHDGLFTPLWRHPFGPASHMIRYPDTASWS